MPVYIVNEVLGMQRTRLRRFHVTFTGLAPVAQQLGVISESKFRKVMTQLLRDNVIFQPPKQRRCYWLTGRPLPCEHPG